MAARHAVQTVAAEPIGPDGRGRSVEAILRDNEALVRRVAELESELAQARGGAGMDSAGETPYRDVDGDARCDRLTGLVGREVLIDRLNHCMARSARTDEQYALMFCDLDGFKLVNDLFGHDAGDNVLIEAAYRLQDVVRAYDTVARFGGDEFVILLEDIHGPADAIAIAQRIVEAISATIALTDGQATIGVSIGVATSNGAATSAETLLARADAAMYEAKRAGKGRVELFGADLNLRLTDHRQLGNDLRSALERDELELWYRPVISLDTGLIISLEGSVRWNHPSRGLLTPETFIPIAYTTGLIEQIDRWVLTTAAADVGAWRRQHSTLVVWITVSTRLLMHGSGPQHIRTLLDTAAAPAHSIGIEVGEDAVLRNFPETVAALRDLQNGSVCIALDNFCGQLAVPQLLTLRPDTVKLDRNFLTLLGQDIEAATAIRSITGMIRPLGITVVAKGVETSEQLASVISLNCDAAQGSITGRAARASDIDFTESRLDPADSSAGAATP